MGDGHSTLFWEDRWIDEQSASDIAPCLYRLVPARIRRRQSVRMGLHNRTWARSIAGGLSTQAIIDYLHLWNAVANVQLTDQPDKTVWRIHGKIGVPHATCWL